MSTFIWRCIVAQHTQLLVSPDYSSLKIQVTRCTTRNVVILECNVHGMAQTQQTRTRRAWMRQYTKPIINLLKHLKNAIFKLYTHFFESIANTTASFVNYQQCTPSRISEVRAQCFSAQFQTGSQTSALDMARDICVYPCPCNAIPPGVYFVRSTLLCSIHQIQLIWITQTHCGVAR